MTPSMVKCISHENLFIGSIDRTKYDSKSIWLQILVLYGPIYALLNKQNNIIKNKIFIIPNKP